MREILLTVFDLIGWYGIGAIAVVFGLIILMQVLKSWQRRSIAYRSRFGTTTFLITLPKFRREEDSQRGPTKESVEQAIATAETFFSSIGGLKAQKGFSAWLRGRSDELAFEIVLHQKLIHFYLTVPDELKQFTEQQLAASYPDASIDPVEDYNVFTPQSVVFGSYLTLKREHAFPFKTYKQTDNDPLNTITNTLVKPTEDEGAVFQFLVRSARASWRDRAVSIAQRMQQGESMSDAVKSKSNALSFVMSFFEGGKKEEMNKPMHKLSPLEEQAVKGIEEKASKAGMDVCIRLLTAADDQVTAQARLSNMINAFSQYNIYQFGNAFEKKVPRSVQGLTRQFIYRTFDEQHSMVLNTEEMASLWHLPLPWTETPNIKWLTARRAAAPASIPGPDEGDIELGFNLYRGVKTPVWMKNKDRTRHMYIIGKSGAGKTQYIARLALQDIQAGHGVAVVDPHGDLIEQILGNIPKDRIDDVVHFNPSDLDRPLGLNMLEIEDESMKDFAVQEMIAIFYKLFPPEMIGPQFEHHMRNVMLTLMADPNHPGSLIEIPRMFSDADFQKKWRARITDPVVNSYWVNEVDKTSDFHKSEMLGYLISKVGRFVENEMMRNIIGQTKSSFDFRRVMDEKKILLVNLSKGKTGDVNAELLGMIIVSKLQMAALGRADIPEDQRHDFFLYIDEFQNFITDSIATILSEARKYKLNLIIAHQYVGQLVKNGDVKIKEAVLGNVGTTFVARIGPEDVSTLEPIFSPDFSGYDLMNSDKFTWYVKMIVDNSQQKPFTLNSDPTPEGNPELAKAIKDLCRLTYGRDKKMVEADIMERAQIGVEKDAPITLE